MTNLEKRGLVWAEEDSSRAQSESLTGRLGPGELLKPWVPYDTTWRRL